MNQTRKPWAKGLTRSGTQQVPHTWVVLNSLSYLKGLYAKAKSSVI